MFHCKTREGVSGLRGNLHWSFCRSLRAHKYRRSISASLANFSCVRPRCLRSKTMAFPSFSCSVIFVLYRFFNKRTPLWTVIQRPIGRDARFTTYNTRNTPLFHFFHQNCILIIIFSYVRDWETKKR